MKKILKQKKGITLIALVITIIVLLILAGISISMLSGDNGILQKAAEAKTNTEKVRIIENARLDILAEITNKKGADLTDEEIKEILGIYFTSDSIPTDLTDLTQELITKNGGYTVKLSDILNVVTVSDGAVESSNIVYGVNYAVQIYGINEDVDENNNTLGLTFGPATGDNYNNKYVTHTYEETSNGSGVYNVKIVTHTVEANGTEATTESYLKNSVSEKVTRTEAQKNKYDINMHEMTWDQIATVADKTDFLDCMLCGDTKKVELSLNDTIGSGKTYNQYGDGAGTLYVSINQYYRKWNPNTSDNSAVGTGVTLDSYEQIDGSNAKNAGGYSVSHIRSTLIGQNAKTNIGYAGDVNLSETNSLYSCLPNSLKNVIIAKKVRYVTGSSISSYSLNDDITDKIWAFSKREMYGEGTYGEGQNNATSAEGLGNDGHSYSKFSNTNSKYYISSYNDGNETQRLCYNEAGGKWTWWLRSPYLANAHPIYYVTNAGAFRYDRGAYGDNGGLVFGFCIN